MGKVTFHKDIYVKGANGVRRRAFVAGQTTDGYVYQAVVKNNFILNPQDLPVYEGVLVKPSLASAPLEVPVVPVVVEQTETQPSVVNPPVVVHVASVSEEGDSAPKQKRKRTKKQDIGEEATI